MGNGYLGGQALRDHNHGAPGDGGVLNNPSILGNVDISGTPDGDTKLVRRQDLRSINLIVNGGLDIWQRGITFNGVANGAYTADKWKVARLNTTANVTQSTFSPKFGAYELQCLYPSLGGAGPTSTLWMEQDIEEFAALKGRTVTLAAWVRTGTVGVRVAIDDGITETRSGYVTDDNTYHLMTVTAAIAAGATRVRVKIGYLATPDMDNGAIQGAFLFDGVTLVPGDVAIDYMPETTAAVVAACQRYYEKRDTVYYRQYINAADNLSIPVEYKVEKAAAPTVTVNGGTGSNLASTSAAGVTTAGFNWLLNSTGAGVTTAGNSGQGNASWTAEVA